MTFTSVNDWREHTPERYRLSSLMIKARIVYSRRVLSWCGWPIVKSILEAAYFIAGIVIAVVAFKGLGQLNVGLEQVKATREIARTNALREALQFATERCQYFADKVVFAQEDFLQSCIRTKCTFMPMSQKLSVRDGEIIPGIDFNTAAFDEESPRLRLEIPTFLNTLEAFAIPFVARVADDDLGYQETGISFCAMVRVSLVLLFHTRQRDYSGRYESTVKLYERWNDRRIAEELGQNLKKAEQAARQTAKPSKIDPLGTQV
jgi:hypothetical protein